MASREVPRLNVLGAMLTGGLVGGAAYAAQLVFVGVLARSAHSTDSSPAALAVAFVMFYFLVFLSTPGFLLGMIVVGWPVWDLLHRTGVRSAWVGVLAGGLAAPLVSQLLNGGIWRLPAIDPAFMAFPGAMSGYVAWRMIYPRPFKRPPAQPSAALTP